MKYVFYYDEIFQDRKITIKNDELNVLLNGNHENFIGCFCGFEQKNLNDVLSKLQQFEGKYKQRFGVSNDIEFKSKVVNDKHYKFGLKSFNKLDYEFYRDFFILFSEINPILQINVINKVEYLIYNIIKNTRSNFWSSFKIEAFIYSFTKFFVVYGNKNLFNALSNLKDQESANRFKEELISNLDIVIENIAGIERKDREIEAFVQLRLIITSFDFESVVFESLNFSYEPNFFGLCKLLEELNLDPIEIKITIDKDNNTFDASKKFKFGKTKQADSKNVIQLRFVDILCGFIGRMIKAISEDDSKKEDNVEYIMDVESNDLSTKRILGSEWFEIDKKTYEFYLLIYDSLIVKHEHYWTTMTMIYSDDVISFYSLLRYFASYCSYDKYNEIESEQHRQRYNSMCLCELSKYYANFD